MDVSRPAFVPSRVITLSPSDPSASKLLTALYSQDDYSRLIERVLIEKFVFEPHGLKKNCIWCKEPTYDEDLAEDVHLRFLGKYLWLKHDVCLKIVWLIALG